MNLALGRWSRYSYRVGLVPQRCTKNPCGICRENRLRHQSDIQAHGHMGPSRGAKLAENTTFTTQNSQLEKVRGEGNRGRKIERKTRESSQRANCHF